MLKLFQNEHMVWNVKKERGRKPDVILQHISPDRDKSSALYSIIKDSYLKPQVHLELQSDNNNPVFTVEINYCTLSA